ncbi:MAG: PadR family transcriptional regulator [Promethearchaeota archaeon]
MVLEIAENFEKAMKKGFISTLILLVLEKGPSHGYEIGKIIRERTLGIWNPPSSTMYTVLKDMTDNGLVRVAKMQEGGRAKKIYEITLKGEKTLNLMIQKHHIIKNSIATLKASMLYKSNLEPLDPTEFPKIGPFMFLESLNEKSKEKKREFLEMQKLGIELEIKYLKKNLKKVCDILLNLKKQNS